MDYKKLNERIKEADCVSLKDQDIADALNAKTLTRVVSRFASYRTLSGILTDEEYAKVKAVLSELSAASPRVADMLSVLALPGDEGGSGGGLDFGDASVRGLCDAYLPTELAAKIKAIAEVPASWAELNGWGGGIAVGHVYCARG